MYRRIFKNSFQRFLTCFVGCNTTLHPTANLWSRQFLFFEGLILKFRPARARAGVFTNLYRHQPVIPMGRDQYKSSLTRGKASYRNNLLKPVTVALLNPLTHGNIKIWMLFSVTADIGSREGDGQSTSVWKEAAIYYRLENVGTVNCCLRLERGLTLICAVYCLNKQLYLWECGMGWGRGHLLEIYEKTPFSKCGSKKIPVALIFMKKKVEIQRFLRCR